MKQPTKPLRQTSLVFRRKDRRFFLSTILLFAVAILLGLLKGLVFPPVFWLFASLITAWLVGVGHLTRIETTPAGITYHHFGVATISSPWSNVEGIRNIMFPLERQRRYVVLREPVPHQQEGPDWSIPRKQVGRVIPIDGWANGDVLEQQIRQYLRSQ